jgi:hypothetical protein
LRDARAAAAPAAADAGVQEDFKVLALAVNIGTRPNQLQRLGTKIGAPKPGAHWIIVA